MNEQILSGCSMQVTETNAEGLKHDFKIVVPAQEIANKIESRLKELSREVRIPGFRPGKVPMSVMHHRYGSSVLGEVLEQLVNSSTDEVLSSRSLKPAMQPKIDVTAFEEGKDLEFTMSVEVLPEISPVDYQSVKLEKLVAKVEDSEIAEAMQRVADSRKVHEAVEGVEVAENGHVLEIDFLGRIDDVPFDGGQGSGYDLELGSGSFIPGFEEQLVGARVGDKVMVNVSFPETYHAKDLAGKPAVFEVDVKALKVAKAPELSDEFAKTLGLDDLEALKNAVREQIENEYAGVTRSRLKRQVLDALAAKTDFEVPAGMVQMEFDGIWKQLEEARKNDRLDEEDKGKSDEELKAEYQALAERRVRLGLLLADIGQKNELQVTQEDLNKAILKEAMRFPGQEQAVFRYFQNSREALESLRAPLYEDKVIDFIIEKSDVVERSVSAEELADDSDEAAA